MATYVATRHKFRLGQSLIDYGNASEDIRVMFVMTNTSVDTEPNVATVGGYGLLDEFANGGVGYTENVGGSALASKTWSEDTGSQRAEFNAANKTFTAVAASTSGRLIEGALIIEFVTNQSSSFPIAFIDFATNFNGNGGNITLQWNAQGIIQVT